MAQKLARVKWRTGQILRPEDFDCLEGSMAADAAARAAISGLPAYGIVKLSVNAPELERAFFVVDELSAVLPTGEVIEVGDNADRPPAFDLKKLGRTDISLYLHVLDPPGGDGDDLDTMTGDEPERRVHGALISDRPAYPNSRR